MDVSTLSLIIGCFGLSAIAGSGVFQALFVMPSYFESPPASLEAFQNDRSFVFWIPLQAVSLLALVVALFSSEGDDRRTAIWGLGHLLPGELGDHRRLLHPGCGRLQQGRYDRSTIPGTGRPRAPVAPAFLGQTHPHGQRRLGSADRPGPITPGAQQTLARAPRNVRLNTNQEGEIEMTTMGNLPEVVTREEWLAARLELLAKEKELTRARDRLNADRRRLPMVRIDKPYTFEGPDGVVEMSDLFEGRPQLVMHHFMFSPDWEQGCSSCSSAADQIGNLRQLHARNTTLVAVSRAPYAKLAAYRERMGWRFPWYSSYGSDFNYDFHATLDDRVAPVLLDYRNEAEDAESGRPLLGEPWTEDMRGTEMPGISTFLRVDDKVFHTYSTFGWGSRSSTTATRGST